MASYSFEIKTYKTTLGFELTLGTYKFHEVIACYGDDGWRFLVYFQADSEPLNPPFTNLDAKVGRIFRHTSQFNNFIDVLRNEKPLYAFLYDDHPGWNNIKTSLEPVGEEES